MRQKVERRLRMGRVAGAAPASSSMLPALLVAAAATVSSATRVPDPLDVSLDVLPVGFCEPSLLLPQPSVYVPFLAAGPVPRLPSSAHESL